MNATVTHVLEVMVVEDEFLIAKGLSDLLRLHGYEVRGPYPSVPTALAQLDQGMPGAAILDVNLDDQRVYPVADRLIAAGVPIVFTTGYDADSLPERYADVPRLQKPVRAAQLFERLGPARG